jgi:DNA-binding transcriptional MerR regulator
MPKSIVNGEASEHDVARYRSGVAARLAGLPVETLRVWERRYGLSDTARSEHGQRLYSDAQVSRLRLIKQLVDQGHPVGAVAQLAPTQLRTLQVLPAAREQAQPVRVALVGHMLMHRLASGGRDVLALDIVATFDQLDGAAARLTDATVDVLLIEIAELNEQAVPVIGALREQLGAAVVVLYRFCASATIRQLRAQGCMVARTPGDVAEIVLLCQAALPGTAAPLLPTPAPQPAPASAPRKFDDQALAALGSAHSNIYCECPRHLSDILMMLNSFERYSEQCAARTLDDALLHQELNNSAAAARVLLEAALERLARAEGLPLPAGLQRPASH